MNLYQKLCNEIKKHGTFWNYYGDRFEDVLKSERTAREFIYNYFKKGSKSYILSEWSSCSNEDMQVRNMHTVNVFFIGAMLQRMVDERILIKSKVSSGYPFSYIWYLLCLAHDLGYVYENYSEVYLGLSNAFFYRPCYMTKQSIKIMPRSAWYRDHGIDIPYSVSRNVGRGKGLYNGNRVCRVNGVIEYSNGTIIKEPRYTAKLINNYFYYRLYEMKTLDHGIIGADELFSKLIINYIREYRVVASQASFTGTFREFYNEKGLHFSSEQFSIFEYIAECVAAHNIYKAENNEHNKEIYVKYSLDCLLPEKFEKISYKDDPLLFILCVADTIEPSKRFPNFDNIELLSKISVDYDVDSNSLCVEIDKELYDSFAGKQYMCNIQKLEEWCEIKVIVRERKMSDEEFEDLAP